MTVIMRMSGEQVIFNFAILANKNSKIMVGTSVTRYLPNIIFWRVTVYFKNIDSF